MESSSPHNSAVNSTQKNRQNIYLQQPSFCLRNYTTLTVLLIYLLILFRFFPDYIDKLPLLSSTYYKTAHNLTFLMFVQDIFPILLISALCFDFVKKEPVFFVLFLSVIAAALLILTELIGGLDQRFVLYSISLPLVVLLIFFLNKNQQINWQRDWILLLAILFLPQFDAKNIFALASYLACFWWVFALFLFRKWRIGNLLKFTLVALAIVTIALMIVGGFTKIPWAISLIIFILILYLDQKSYEKKELSRLSACVIFLVLSYFLSLNIAAIFNLKNNYDSYKFSSPNHFNSEVIKVIKHYSHKDESFVAIAEGIPGIYPSITYAGRKNALPFLQYGFLFKQIGNEKESENPSLKYMMNRLKQQMEAPNNKLVFVENQHYAQKDRCVIGFLENYFRDAEFREIFLKNYVFLTLITNETGDHEFEVYIRQ